MQKITTSQSTPQWTNGTTSSSSASLGNTHPSTVTNQAGTVAFQNQEPQKTVRKKRHWNRVAVIRTVLYLLFAAGGVCWTQKEIAYLVHQWFGKSAGFEGGILVPAIIFLLMPLAERSAAAVALAIDDLLKRLISTERS